MLSNAWFGFTGQLHLVTTPDKKQNSTSVRVNFQRQVYDMAGQLVKSEAIHDPNIYNGFFSKLSKSLFLEAHEV